MGKRSKNHSHYDILAESEDEGGEAPAAAPRLGRMLQEVASHGSDGRIRHKSTLVNVPQSPSKSQRRQADASLLRDDNPLPEMEQPNYDLREAGSDSGGEDSDDEGGRELRESDDPLKQWVRDHRDEFLDELLRWEGRGDHRSIEACEDCRAAKLAADNRRAADVPKTDPPDAAAPSTEPHDPPTVPHNAVPAQGDHRCTDCIGGGQLLCAPCLVRRHRHQPLHRIQFWNGEYFVPKTLRELGLRMQLGHWAGYEHRCPVPEPVRNDVFVLIDDHGIHEVSLDFCGCGSGVSHNVQLLRAGLYPATTTSPRTAATFSVLRRFHLLSFESKCSSYEFYHSLARETDNGGVKPPRNRYHEWRRMTREQGLWGPEPGECALLCPACPHPGKNLPEGWETAADDEKFLYALFLAIDANFRLKRKDVSSEEKDPGLGPGWAFFCEVGSYMQHVEKHWKEPQERSRCVAHDAVDKPDKESRGTVSSGIGAVDCARHNMKRPNAVGDLQLGERYINMDYMFFVGIKGTELLRFYVSYDIACQWHINIWKRMMKYDHDIRFVYDGKYMTFLVPKFHLPAHIEACNLLFSFNLMRDVGQTDGEAPERGWANTNPLAGSTKEMGPGSRRDHLDDHFNDWNHKKIVGFGRLMLRKMQEAVPEMAETKLALEDMEAALATEVVFTWTEMTEAWEESFKTPWEEVTKPPNPFESSAKDTHLAKVRYDLAKEAAAREEAGTEDDDEVHGDMHVTECIAMGVQLEEQQRVLKADVASTGQHPTDDQRRVMVERTSKLRRKILASWVDIQTQHFPSVARVREEEDRARMRAAKTQVIPGVLVHEMALWLPSALMNRAGASQEESGCRASIMEYEYRLRVGQAHEALDELRRLLLVRTHLYSKKDFQTMGVKRKTRSQGVIENMTDQIQRIAEQYRGARHALVTLGRVLGVFDWQVVLKPLLADDVRGMPKAHFGDPERQAGKKGKKKGKKSSKRRKVKHTSLSWIWLAAGRAGEEGEVGGQGQQAAMDEALRIEWARTRARSLRWSEEVRLLEEEMRRIQQFLLWQSGWWMTRVSLRSTRVRGGIVDDAQREGDAAYALRQAAGKADLCAVFAKKWAQLPALVSDARAGRFVATVVEEYQDVDPERGIWDGDGEESDETTEDDDEASEDDDE
ncbi:hypothetical protein C8J57DRAFT_1557922 [Mycena rebaudengoi]|nr:hypothetical protein C8J57DRAFT_1557922 [Mycena rebaudengoi]